MWTEGGLVALLAALSNRTIRIDRQHLLAADPGHGADDADNGVTWHWLSIDEVGRPAHEAPWRHPGDSVVRARSWIEQGDRCLVGFIGGEGVTSLWVTDRSRHLPGVSLPIGERLLFVYKTFTAVQWRGRGLNKAALKWVIRWARDQGYERVFIDVSARNAASQRAVRAAGFRDVAAFWIVTIANRRRAVVPARTRRIIAGVERGLVR